MSFTSLFKRPALLISVGVFLAIELFARIAPVELRTQTAVYLTIHRRQLLDASEPEFDYLILGESKSLSIRGKAPSAAEPWSVYNLSMPAMGSRYFAFLVEKYLHQRQKKPAAIIFAGDPGVFQDSWNAPLHDPQQLYSDGRQDSLARYLWLRVVRRVPRGFAAPAKSGAPQEALWDSYSHRYLHLFSPGELAAQFHGAERIFALREALPMQYHTFRYREAIRNLISDPLPSAAAPLPEYCADCSQNLRAECRARLPSYQDNMRLAEQLDRDSGAINLGDRIDPVKMLQYNLIRKQLIAETRKMFDAAEPDLEPLRLLLDVAREQGIRVAIASAPTVDQYEDIGYYRKYRLALEKLLQNRPEARQFRFAQPYYQADDFVDQIHYNCAAAQQVNDDFHRNVMPQILRFAPPSSRKGVQSSGGPD